MLNIFAMTTEAMFGEFKCKVIVIQLEDDEYTNCYWVHVSPIMINVICNRDGKLVGEGSKRYEDEIRFIVNDFIKCKRNKNIKKSNTATEGNEFVSLLDIALDMKDYEWAKEIINKQGEM